MWTQRSSLFAPILFLFVLSACDSAIVPTATTLPVLPTSTPGLVIVPSPTDIQLPFNPNVISDEYCKPPYAVLPVNEGNDISEEQIVYELLKIWLRRYTDPKAPPFCRIEAFTIDKVYNDPDMYTTSLEPRGDFMRVVVFSIQLIQIPSDWMSFAGELDQNNWLHTGHIVAITKTSEGYQMEFAYP